MRSFTLSVMALAFASSSALAQSPPTGAAGGPAKENANPCRDEVAAALSKLRKSSWFRMTTTMITEKGPSNMVVDYVLPDKMHQKVTETLTNTTSEVILIGEKAWANQGNGWSELPSNIMSSLRSQMFDNVVQEQTDVGNYSCKGKVQAEGRDALSYKLEDEPAKDSTAPKNETYRMFYVDAVTGLPVSNALMAPGREKSPLFKATYSFPIDLQILPPKDVIQPPAEKPKN
jgi:hypothetical protein